MVCKVTFYQQAFWEVRLLAFSISAIVFGQFIIAKN
jgi:hypothetical protein